MNRKFTFKCLACLIPLLLVAAVSGSPGYSAIIQSFLRATTAAGARAVIGAGTSSSSGLIYNYDGTQFTNTTSTNVSFAASAVVTNLFATGTTSFGVTTPSGTIDVASTSTSSPRGINSKQFTTSTDAAELNLIKYRGTEAAKTTIVTGDRVGSIKMWGYDGSTLIQDGGIRAESTGTIAANRVPGQLIFSTATDASPSVLTDRMVLGPGGFLGLGNGTPLAPLDFFGSNARTTIGGNGGPNITANGYFSSSWKYIESAKASVLFGLLPNGASSGDFGIYTAPSGTANSAITYTPRFMLMENGTCGFNTTNPGAFGIAVNQATGQCFDLIYNDSDGSPANHCSFVVSSGGNLTIAPSGGTVSVTGRIASTTTAVTIATAATTFAVASNVVTVTGDALANVVATITGGVSGQTVTLIFVDGLVTVTDDASAASNTVNLSGAWVSSANDTLTIVFNGTSWREVARSVN